MSSSFAHSGGIRAGGFGASVINFICRSRKDHSFQERLSDGFG